MTMDQLITLDRSLFMFLNSLHTPLLDQAMFWISKSMVWIPFYVVLLYLVYRKYGKRTLWVLVFVALMIGASDQLANLFKDGVFLTSSEAHRPFGDYWETLNPDNRWGGMWNDGNHYEMKG